MQIIGSGMLARSLTPYQTHFADVVAFAGGVADSRLTDDESYQRETTLLHTTLERCCQNGQRLVYFSSAGAIYGPTESVRDETTPVEPITRYGQHKLTCENLIRDSGARFLIIRLANLVGAAQNGAQLIPALAAQVRSGQVTVQRRATRDIMDVDDFASIFSRIVPIVADNDFVLVASGISVSVVDLVHAIQEAAGVSALVDIVDRGEQQRISIAKLQRYLPDIAFDADYFRSVIRKYVGVTPEIRDLPR